MALIMFGMSGCPICGETLDGPPVFATSGVFLPDGDPLQDCCDAGMHWDCYAAWPHRPRFARAWVEACIAAERLNPYWGRAYLDEAAFVTVNPQPPVEQAAVRLFATGSDLRVPLGDWERWLAGDWEEDEELHPVERAALEDVVPALALFLPTAGEVVAAVNWDGKAEVAEREQAAIREREEKRLRVIAAANERCRWMELRRKHKGLTCPHCGLASRDFRYVDSGSERTSYFVCPDCGRSFGPDTARG